MGLAAAGVRLNPASVSFAQVMMNLRHQLVDVRVGVVPRDVDVQILPDPLSRKAGERRVRRKTADGRTMSAAAGRRPARALRQRNPAVGNNA